MSASKKNLIIFFEFISFILVIISYILYIIQSFINYHFINSKSKSAITERLLYKKFSQEIYDNIRSYPVYDIKNRTNHNSKSLILSTKLDTLFDCQGVYNGLLNEKNCQNKLVNNLTCCKSECCFQNNSEEIVCNNYNFNVKNSSLDKNKLTYNIEEMFDDPKRRYCQYMNLFSGNTSKVLTYNLEMEQFNYSYEMILLDQNNINKFIKIDGEESKNSDFDDCGEIDSLKHHLFVKGIKCPINYVSFEPDNKLLFFDSITESSLGIIVKNYLTEIPPLVHEWNDIFKSGEVTIKDINELLIEKNRNNSELENFYKKQDAYFYISQIPDFKNRYKNSVNNKQKIYWYTTNYIGFETAEDLKYFKSIFKENDYNDNPLSKMATSLKPSIESSFIFIFILLFYIFFIIKFANELKNKPLLEIIIFKINKIIVVGTLIVFVILYCIFTQIMFKSISIKIDSNYKEILKIYNERRKQKYFLAGIILHCITCFLNIFYFFVKDEKKQNNMNDTQNIQKRDSTEMINNLSDTAEQIDKNVAIMQQSTMRMKNSLKFSIKDEGKINVIEFSPK